MLSLLQGVSLILILSLGHILLTRREQARFWLNASENSRRKIRSEQEYRGTARCCDVTADGGERQVRRAGEASQCGACCCRSLCVELLCETKSRRGKNSRLFFSSLKLQDGWVAKVSALISSLTSKLLFFSSVNTCILPRPVRCMCQVFSPLSF